MSGERAPLVTVGIPFFDEERCLADAIRCVLAQTMRDFELILVDDGSTDRSLAVARSFDDPRITVLSDGRRRHLPARLNEIVRHARAPFVARMDADDLIHPSRLERQLDLLQRDASCDVVGTWAVLADGDDVFGVVENGTLPPSVASALVSPILAHATVLGRRAWFVANPYDEALTLAEDRDLWCRVAPKVVARVVPECLYVVRLSPEDARFVPGYVEAQRQARIVFGRHGPASVGHLRTMELVGATYLKNAAVRIAARAGLARRLVRRRGRPPTSDERARAAEAFAVVRG